MRGGRSIRNLGFFVSLALLATACAQSSPVSVGESSAGAEQRGSVLSLQAMAQEFISQELPSGLECTDPSIDDLEHISFDQFVNTEKAVIQVTLATKLKRADLRQERWGVPEPLIDDFVGVEISNAPQGASEVILTKRGLGSLARKVEADPDLEILYWTLNTDDPYRADFYTVSKNGEIDALFECSSNQAVLLNEAASRLPANSVTAASLTAALNGDPESQLLQTAFTILDNAEPEPVRKGYENQDYLEPNFMPEADTGERVLISLVLPKAWDGDGSSSLSVCLRSRFGTYGCIATDLNQDDQNAGVVFPTWLGDETPLEIWIDRQPNGDASASNGEIGPVVQIGQINSDAILSGAETIEGAYVIPVVIEEIASNGEDALERWLEDSDNTTKGSSRIKVN